MTVQRGLSQSQMEDHVKARIELCKAGDNSFLYDTEDSLSAQLDEALQKVADAAAQGAGLQQAIDNVWLVFYNQFPSGS